jgi:hypothetical protein
VTSIMRVRTTLTYGSGGPGLHTAYWIPGTPPGVTADANDAVGRVRGFWLGCAGQFPTTFSAQVQSGVDLLDDLTGSLQGQLSATAVAAVAGTSGTASAARSSMILAQLRTNTVFGGRLLKGRWYLGPPKPSAIGTTGGTDPAVITAVNAAGAAMIAPGATASALAVWHRPVSGGGGAAVPVSSLSTWNEIAVLRSRRDA